MTRESPSEGAGREPGPLGVVRRSWDLAREYASDTYLGDLRALAKIPVALRETSPGARAVTLSLLGFLAVLTVATPLLSVYGDRFSHVAFRDVLGDPRQLPVIGLFLALLGVAAGAAAVVAGASHTRLAIFLVTVPISLYTVSSIALIAGQSYRAAAASWLVPAVAALTPVAGRGWRRFATLAGLSALATWHIYTFTPLLGRFPDASPGLLLAVIAPVSLLIGAGLARLPWRLSVSRAFGLALIVNLIALSGLWRTDYTVVAREADRIITGVFALLAVFYFVLGARVAESSLSGANLGLKAVDRVVGFRRLWLVLAAAWIVEALLIRAQLQGVSAGPGPLAWLHTAALVVGSIIGLGLLARGQVTEPWVRGILGVWLFAYLLPMAYHAAHASLGQSREVGAKALMLFIFGLVMEVVKTLPTLVRRESRWGAAQGMLLVYLSALTLIATITHFQFVSRNTGWMAETFEWEFLGTFTLLPPMLLLLFVREQRWLAAPSPGLVGTAFLGGALVSLPITLLRMGSLVEGQWTLAASLGTVAVAEAGLLAVIGALVLASRSVGRWLDAVAVGVATALGFAVVYLASVALFFFQQLGLVWLKLTYASAAAERLVEAIIVNNALLLHRPWADYCHAYFVSVPAGAVMAGALFWGRRHGRPRLGLLGALGAGAVSVALAAPIYTRAVFLESLQLGILDEVAGDRVAVACVLVPLALLLVYLYLTVWRLDVRGDAAEKSDEASTAPPDAQRSSGPDAEAGARQPAGAPDAFLPRVPGSGDALAGPATASADATLGRMLAPATTRAGLITLFGIAACVAVGATWLTLSPGVGRAPAALDPYRDPAREFAIRYPRGWRVSRLAPSITVFYRGTKTPSLDGGIHLLVRAEAELPCGTNPALLLDALHETERAKFPDFELEASLAGSPTLHGERATQRIRVEASKTLSTGIRIVGHGWIAFTTGSGCPSWAFIGYQAPDFLMATLEPTFRRMAESYERPAE